MCLQCGDDLSAVGRTAEGEPPVTKIDGWSVIERLPATSEPWERFLVENGEVHAVLTLYVANSEPDPAVYEVIRRMDRDHVPELLATGRWNDRAFEVTERIVGASLTDAGYFAADDLGALRPVIDQLGRALANFAERGLRHRDLKPANILVRSMEPLDLVITGFGSARLSDFDLEAAAPLELTRYSSPEAIVGGVAAASDWWSLGVIVLEHVTRGTCFDGVNDKALHIHVITRGLSLPEDLEPRARLLLRGLLARDPLKRWQWPQVRRWLANEEVEAPGEAASDGDGESGPALRLGEREYRRPESYALAAAEEANWEAAQGVFLRGALGTWLEERGSDGTTVAAVRRLASTEDLPEDFRHALAVMALNRSLPLTLRGDIVTPAWLLAHPLEGYEVITGAVSRQLEEMGREPWLVRLRARAAAVRERARILEIELDEERARIALLTSSRANLEAERATLRRIYPEADHAGLASLIEHERLSEEDLVVLVSAAHRQFVPLDTLVDDAVRLAEQSGVTAFARGDAAKLFVRPRREIYGEVDLRTAGFASCPLPRLNEWASSFRVERRISLPRAAVLLAVQRDQWSEPPKQQYVAALMEHFEKRVAGEVQRGPLVRLTIAKSAARVDLCELGTALRPADAILDHVVRRTEVPVELDPGAWQREGLLSRLRRFASHADTFKRDTGIDGRYLGFPFLLIRDSRLSESARPRIAPVLLWPTHLSLAPGQRGSVSLAFDREREEGVRPNPALEGLVGREEILSWQRAHEELLTRSALRAADVMDVLGVLAAPTGRTLGPLPGKDVKLRSETRALVCAAVLLNAEFSGQAIAADLGKLRRMPPAGTSLETVLRLAGQPRLNQPTPSGARDRYLTVESDPSQERAIVMARQAPGVLIKGPPGTGKSQTIVNIVGDCIGRGETLLIVCQKQAALRVVQKRLEAEGLGDRLMAVVDMTRDREPIMRAIRSQLDGLRETPVGVTTTLVRARERSAAVVDALEGELDRHHQALHSVDDATGLTYRGILAELIELERHSATPAVPVMRSRFLHMPRARVSELQEACGPLARLWLEACYEDSPLEPLKSFSVDSATLAVLEKDLAAFGTAEAARAQVMRAARSSFEVADAAPVRGWLMEHGERFAGMPLDQRSNLSRWFGEFEIDRTGSSRGTRALENLAATIKDVRKLETTSVDFALLAKLARVPPEEVKSWTALAVEATATVSAFWRLGRFFKRRRCKNLLRSLGEEPTQTRVTALRDALLLEGKVRPHRESVREPVNGPLLSDDTVLVSPKEVVAKAAALIAWLEPIAAAAAAVRCCPASARAEMMARAGTAEAYQAFRADVEAALARHGARLASHAALNDLSQWFAASWGETHRQAVDGNATPLAGIPRIAEALPTAIAFQRFRSRAADLDVDVLALFAALRPLENALRALASDILESTVRGVIEREALLAWKGRIENAQPALLMQREEIESKVKSLAKAEEEMREVNRRILAANIDASRLAGPEEWESITRLRGPRRRSLREAIEQGRDLGLTRLRPVWLMNPDTVSRLLPLAAGSFDVLIFDEASQMLVEHSLPALYRAKRVVISGDEKQMPPTSFFSSRPGSDEDGEFDGEDLDEGATEAEREIHEETWNRREIKDCPDLLALGGSCLPDTILQVHYRSKYRELIRFSNAAFYAGRLNVPARHPDGEIRRVRPIEVVRVDGTYEEQMNREEARRVVDVVADLWRTGSNAPPSIGVVTFNRKQADLVEDEIADRVARDDAFLSAYSRERDRVQDGEDMGFFVKNVENVQGDERDVIVFSTTFGRDRRGAFRRLFGVLGQRGGERRLNVAITRAREKVVLVTSMPINDISDMLGVGRQPNKPRDYLQAYLDYATKVSDGELELARSATARMSPERGNGASRSNGPDQFVEAVASYLSEMGHTAVGGNDGDAFGVDLAVIDPRTGQFGLAIECDSPRDAHGQLASARAREIWRPSVLKRAIPIVHRVSSYGWYHAGEEERRRLGRALERALLGSRA